MPGPTELALILVIVLILFGAGKLPQVFEAFGTGIKKFREAQREGEDDIAELTGNKPRQLAEPVISEAEEVGTKAHQHTTP